MRPAARISINGKDRDSSFMDRLVSVNVTDEAGVKSDSCEITLDARGDFAAPPIGAEVKVWIGYEPQPVYMGKFKIDEWRKEGPAKLISLSAKSAELTTEIKATKTRSHHDTTIGAIVRKVAADHGLTATIDSAIASRPVAHIDQQTESDLGFLSRLAKRNGATFKLSDGKVIFTAKGSRSLPSGGSKPAIEIVPAQTSTWAVSSNKRGDYGSVKCAYMDHEKGKRVTVSAGSGKPAHRDKRLYGSKSEAQAAARATLGDLGRGQKSAEFSGPGNPALFAESLVTLKGFDADCDGEYLAKTVTHSYSSSGYTTSVSLETEGGATATDSA